MDKFEWVVGREKVDTIKCKSFSSLTAFSQELGCGTNGCIYGIPINYKKNYMDGYNNNELIVKIGKIEKNTDVNKEYQISKLMGDVGIGPRIYEYLICDNYFAIVMQKLDINIEDYINNRKEINIVESQFIYNKIREKLLQLYFMGYDHGDLHIKNIMLIYSENKIMDVKLIDFGSTHQINQEMDKYPFVTYILGDLWKNLNKYDAWDLLMEKYEDNSKKLKEQININIILGRDVKSLERELDYLKYNIRLLMVGTSPGHLEIVKNYLFSENYNEFN